MKRISLPHYLHQVVDDDPDTLVCEFATGAGEKCKHYRAVAHNNSGRWDAAIWKLHDDIIWEHPDRLSKEAAK